MKTRALFVHLFTASGLIPMMLALVDILFVTLSLCFLFLSGWRSWSLRTRDDTQ